MKKFLKRLVAGMLIVSCICGLAGCTVYTKNDLVNYTKKRLEEEYGEKFEIKTVIDGSNTIAYPVNNPELLFETSYVIRNGNGRNEYLEEIVAQQLKELIEEKLADFKYKYYVDVDVPWTKALVTADKNITIEEYAKLSGQTPRYDIFLSSKVLDCKDESLHNLSKEIASAQTFTQECYIYIYFLTDEYFNKVIDNFSTYPSTTPSLHRELESEFGSVALMSINNGELRENFDKFNEKIKEIRENELYR